MHNIESTLVSFHIIQNIVIVTFKEGDSCPAMDPAAEAVLKPANPHKSQLASLVSHHGEWFYCQLGEEGG